VLTASALEREGFAEIWAQIMAYQQSTINNGFWFENRRNQAHYWLHETLMDGMKTAFYNHPDIQAMLPALEDAVLSGKISPFAAARTLLEHLNFKQ
jgi:LAO/AO transport system kinase